MKLYGGKFTGLPTDILGGETKCMNVWHMAISYIYILCDIK